MRGLKNKKVWITGTSSGIGLATAQRYYEEGSQLYLIDRVVNPELETMFPERMTFVHADLGEDAGIATCSAGMLKYGVDVLINNAGITRDATAVKMTMDQWDQVIMVNLTAVFRLTQVAGRIMKEQGGGVVISASSVVAHYGNFGQANYSATKGALISMTKTLSKEWGRYGIRVLAVAPGFIQTPILNSMPDKVIEMMNGKPALRRIGQPEEMAAVYAFLGSDDASYLTGTCINADGGVVLE